ncbi:putative phosphohydrolase [Rubrobacter radiotolerans]|uniref:Metallophosphoesterase n=1 Tax=Rubrobacter radiotolerans TaxID=42256 RepID=A0A023X698_RUBRA|nr:metallophosphoesterase [Rubrobacter radiotolerans]AHY47878.1 putative phosphohydrolase [Rubrobacter radiotolerans]MDX5892516.1 metallophosphoesterase [Rubrobacter radiotolerans]SMC07807.1 3',5'-cyclic AMP phosphodiesterase CpdA [Rubrobacter radiotolerans DSM 5868]
MTKIVHISDLHFGRPSVEERLDSLLRQVREISPEAIAVSGDLTQRCSNREFRRAKEYLETLSETAPYLVIPGNHDIRWLGAVARNLGFAGMFREKAHRFKYSRYMRHISEDLSPSLEVPGAVIAGLNTAHGITRGSLTRRLKDLGVIGHVRSEDVRTVNRAFKAADPEAVRIVMIHHNPIKGDASGRHGLANTKKALRSFVSLGAELVLCGHDHQEAVHTTEESYQGLIISTAGTISNRLRPGRSSSFNLVEIDSGEIHVVPYLWREEGSGADPAFVPSERRSFPRRNRRRTSGQSA